MKNHARSELQRPGRTPDGLRKTARQLRRERLRDPVRKARNRRAWLARKEKLDEVYAYMIATLGGYCGSSCADPELGCGTRRNLQLQHNDGRPWVASKVGPFKRCKLYVDDFVRGKLGVLCRQCNELDGGRRWQQLKAARDEVPF